MNEKKKTSQDLSYNNYIIFSLIFYITTILIYNFFSPSKYLSFLGIILILSLLYIGAIYADKKLSFKSNVFFIAPYQFIISIIILLYFSHYAGNYLGFNPVDSKYYFDLACKTSKMSHEQFIKFIESGSEISNISDIGFPYIQRLAFIIGGSSLEGIIVLIILNILSQILSTIIIFKISSIYFNQVESKVIALVWGYSFLVTYYGASGLKEAFFTLCTVTALLGMLKLLRKVNIISLLIFVVGLLSILFFRYYISLFFIFTILSATLLRSIYYKYFLYYNLSIIIFILTGLHLLQNYMPELYYIVNAEPSPIPMLNGWSGDIMKSILAIIGPIPKLHFDNLYNDTIISSYIAIKFYLFPFFIIGCVNSIKLKSVRFYPIITLYILNSMMLVVSNAFFDIRFMSIMLPIFLIVAFNGFKSSSLTQKSASLLLCTTAIAVYS